MKTVLIVGPKRPPFGGIVTYMRMLTAGLESQGVEVEHLDIIPRNSKGQPRLSRSRKLIRFFTALPALIRSRAPVVHLLASSYFSLYASLARGMILRMLGKKVVISLMGGHIVDIIEGIGWLRKLLGLAFYLGADVIIGCNPEIREAVSGIVPGRERCVYLSNALPRSDDPSARLPDEVEKFLTNNSPKLLFVGRTSELYGLQIMFPAMAELKTEFPNLGALLLTTHTKSGPYYEYLVEMCRELGLTDSVLFLDSIDDLVPLYEQCDVLVRPSLVDGDAMSIREALGMGMPVVASDASPRPAECLVYECKDSNRLAEAIGQALERTNSSDLEQNNLNTEGQANVLKLMNLYSELSSCSGRSR